MHQFSTVNTIKAVVELDLGLLRSDVHTMHLTVLIRLILKMLAPTRDLRDRYFPYPGPLTIVG